MSIQNDDLYENYWFVSTEHVSLEMCSGPGLASIVVRNDSIAPDCGKEFELI